MLKIFCLAAAVAAVSMTPAFAQEDDRAGFYAGADIGYGKSKSDLSYTPRAGAVQSGDADKNGLRYGGFAGYGLALGESFYLGAEAGLGAGGGDISRTFGGNKISVEPKLRYSLVGKAGLRVGDGGLIYGKAGVERRRFEVSTTRSKEDLKLQGVVYGVGYQQMLSEVISVRGELLRVDYGDKTASFAAGDRVKVDADETRLTFGGAVHF